MMAWCDEGTCVRGGRASAAWVATEAVMYGDL